MMVCMNIKDKAKMRKILRKFKVKWNLKKLSLTNIIFESLPKYF